MPASDVLAGLPLVDDHCHGVLLTELDRAGVERGLTESDAPAPPGTTMFDTPVGLAVRRWCAPVLGLEPHADADAYLAVRARLGTAESTRRLLRAALLSDVLVDTGLRGPDLSSPAELAEAAGARGHVVVRLESVAEDVARAGTTAASFADDFGERLRRASAGAVAVKSIAAYRCGLDLPGHRPHDSEVRRAAAAWLVEGEQEGRWRLRDARETHRTHERPRPPLGAPLPWASRRLPAQRRRLPDVPGREAILVGIGEEPQSTVADPDGPSTLGLGVRAVGRGDGREAGATLIRVSRGPCGP